MNQYSCQRLFTLAFAPHQRYRPPMTEQRYRGRCHCGAVSYDVTLRDGLATASRCNCSFCEMRGAVALTAPKAGITFHTGRENLSLYQFGSKTAKHYFCKTCGIYTHHERRFPEGELGINAACLEGISPFDFQEVVVFDGTEHPSDNEGVEYIAGTLSFHARSRDG